MSFHQALKQQKSRPYYMQVRHLLKNAFADLLVNRASKKKVTFKRQDVNVVYQICGTPKRPVFVVSTPGALPISYPLNKTHLPKIQAAIEATYPETLTPMCVRFNAKLSNTYTKKRFDEDTLLNLAPWRSTQESENPLTMRVDEDYVYQADSQAEIRILKYLLSHGCVKKLRGQNYAIPYGKKTYYPDFVYLNHLNQIVILEVKSKGTFATAANLEKYTTLAKHCEAHGYVYGMIDTNFNTLVSQMAIPVNRSFEKALLETLHKEGIVTSKTITALRKTTFSHIKRRKLEHMLTKIIITNQLCAQPSSVHDLRITQASSSASHYYLMRKLMKPDV